MAGRDPAEAEREFYDRVVQSLRCIVEPNIELSARGGARFDRSMLLALDLPLAATGLAVYATMQHDIVEAPRPAGPWRVTLRRLAFEYERTDGSLVFGYRYWKLGDETHSFCTVGRDEDQFACHRRSVEDLVQFGIEFLGVDPLIPEWAEVLKRNRADHLTWRTTTD